MRISVLAGGRGAVAPRFPKFGQNSNFSGSDNDQLQKYCVPDLGEDLFFYREHLDLKTKIEKYETDSK